MAAAGRGRKVKEDWHVLSHYQRFESSVALALTLVVVLVALYRLAEGVIAGLILGVLDPLEHQGFQRVFGEIMTLLIALLAIARKFIILDLKQVSAEHLFALAAVTLVLSVSYWLLRERDDRMARGS